VQRQQRVYAALGEVIRSGALHAVNIRALTQAEAGAAGSGA
jgi:acid stress-induced BolA-like protein IbaG/YrbA